MYLIFGSRNKAKDYYFGQEWVKMQENYENFKIFTAFSRDQDDKCYVQHVIRVRIPIKFNYSKVKEIKKKMRFYFNLLVKFKKSCEIFSIFYGLLRMYEL